MKASKHVLYVHEAKTNVLSEPKKLPATSTSMFADAQYIQDTQTFTSTNTNYDDDNDTDNYEDVFAELYCVLALAHMREYAFKSSQSS
jgi:hypothetical protein